MSLTLDAPSIPPIYQMLDRASDDLANFVLTIDGPYAGADPDGIFAPSAKTVGILCKRALLLGLNAEWTLRSVAALTGRRPTTRSLDTYRCELRAAGYFVPGARKPLSN